MGVVQVIEHFPSKYKNLCSNPSIGRVGRGERDTQRKKMRERERKGERERERLLSPFFIKGNKVQKGSCKSAKWKNEIQTQSAKPWSNGVYSIVVYLYFLHVLLLFFKPNHAFSSPTCL
jgi:hypothetical protein